MLVTFCLSEAATVGASELSSLAAPESVEKTVGCQVGERLDRLVRVVSAIADEFAAADRKETATLVHLAETGQ